MTVAVDTNILLDILLPDPGFLEQSLFQLVNCSKSHLLIISEAVYGELASQFSEEKMLVEFLSKTGISLESSSPEALWLASRAWSTYTKNRSTKLQCNSCGNMQLLVCDNCNTVITSRQHVISDFLIGGHALIHADFLLTRDRGYYKGYFPELSLIRL